jgi:hypothetical protein
MNGIGKEDDDGEEKKLSADRIHKLDTPLNRYNNSWIERYS